MIKALSLGGAAALVLGAVAGGIAQDAVGAVVSSTAGSRLEVASYAAPVEPTPWAEGDATAPYAMPASVLLTPAAPAPVYEAVAWTPPEPQEPAEIADPSAPERAEAAALASLESVDASAEEDAPAPAPDLVPDATSESLAPAPAPEPAPDLIVAGLTP